MSDYKRLQSNLNILSTHNTTNKSVLHLTGFTKTENELIKEIVSDAQKIIDKIENGTLKDFPCKVGDTVWEIFYSKYEERILELEVTQIVIQETIVYRCKTKTRCLYSYGWVKNEDFGKTVFLTKNEAEKKLKELQNEMS